MTIDQLFIYAYDSRSSHINTNTKYFDILTEIKVRSRRCLLFMFLFRFYTTEECCLKTSMLTMQ